MKPKSNDPLQILLRQALYQQKIKVNVLYQKSTIAPRDVQQYVPQCKRPEWTPGRLIALVHQSSQGRRTYLGVFQELKSDLFKARRLVPSDAQAHGTLPVEIVTQDYWLYPKVHVAAADSPDEVRAIEARFAELMREVK